MEVKGIDHVLDVKSQAPFVFHGGTNVGHTFAGVLSVKPLSS